VGDGEKEGKGNLFVLRLPVTSWLLAPLRPSKVNTVFSQPNLKAKPTMSTELDELKRKLIVFKSLRSVVQDDARKKTGEASEAVRRAAQVEGVCAKIEAEIQEGERESESN
jgi:hypothetical protein